MMSAELYVEAARDDVAAPAPIIAARRGAPPFLHLDPGLAHTATCRSSLSHIDGEQGTLTYAGRPVAAWLGCHIEVLAAHLVLGPGATQADRDRWVATARRFGRLLPEVRAVLVAAPPAAEPSNVLAMGLAALPPLGDDATLGPLCLAQVLAMVAWLGRHRGGPGRPEGAAVAGKRDADTQAGSEGTDVPLAEQFARALLARGGLAGDSPSRRALVSAIDLVLVLHAEHEQNCSTHTVRAVASTQADLPMALVAGMAAFKGRLHGGASVEVARMVDAIGSPASVGAFVEQAISAGRRIMGFGHRVYRCWDPRATIMRDRLAATHFVDPELERHRRVALALAETVTAHPYFQARRIFPNPDLFNGIFFRQIGLRGPHNIAMLSASRTVGWLAHFAEAVRDGGPLMRPRHLYVPA